MDKNKAVIEYDIEVWCKHKNINYKLTNSFFQLLNIYPEFRNLFYYRIGAKAILLNILCRKCSTLFLATPEIGPGLYIQHGFATIIAAKKIGKDCFINQQVTIGYTESGKTPTLGDQVRVSAGAKVLGDIQVGNNVKIGANAVVLKDIPDNCTVVGIPAYIIKKDGQKVGYNLNT
ncbi:serine O-acetyltransferase [Algoriphagus boritolerans]|nr:serine acetyltransferase [Algoriphagus boritolerans]